MGVEVLDLHKFVCCVFRYSVYLTPIYLGTLTISLSNNYKPNATLEMKSKLSYLVICTILFTCANTFSQNPTVQDGVAIYHSDTTIGRKFQVPESWDKILIKENVTITGSFYFPTRTRPMEIAGESRETSIIKGDGTRPTDDGMNGRSYSAIRFDKAPDVYVHDLKSLDPMKFHIGGGFGKVLVERCDIIETRGSHSSDGIHGGEQNVIVRDCYISTYDDALYTRECTLVENTTIVHNKNGAPFMTSWGAPTPKGYECIIRNCTVIDNSSEGYNHGVVAWANKHSDGPEEILLKFEGTFTRSTNPGKNESSMYTIGRWGGETIKNATIKVDSICPSPNSIDLRPGAQNCYVGFVNCANADDTVSPTIPGQPAVGKITSNSIAFSWEASTDDISLNGYELYLNDEFHSTIFNNSVTLSNLFCENQYEFKVRAFDGGMNYSEFSDSVVVSTATCNDITSRIEAELFTNQSGIQTEKTNDAGGGDNIGFINANDWSSYRVYVPESNNYVVSFRVASESSGGNIELFSDDVSKGSVTVPVTGGWQNWVTVSETFALEEGAQDIKLLYTGGGGFLFNVNWFQAALPNSTNNITANNYTKIYPNPFNDILNIESQSANVQLFDIAGRAIDIEIQKKENGFQMNTSALETGLYMVKLENAAIIVLKQ